MDFELTEEEKKAIRALKRVAKIWPRSLRLFVGDGILYVMRTSEDGSFAEDNYGSIDQDYIVTPIDIVSDGGGW